MLTKTVSRRACLRPLCSAGSREAIIPLYQAGPSNRDRWGPQRMSPPDPTHKISDSSELEKSPSTPLLRSSGQLYFSVSWYLRPLNKPRDHSRRTTGYWTARNFHTIMRYFLIDGIYFEVRIADDSPQAWIVHCGWYVITLETLC